MTDIATAILAINPNAKVSVNAEDLDQITWHDGTVVISKADIQAKQAELQAEYDAEQWKRNRQAEYPSWQDQMDMQYHDKVNGTSTWQTAIAKVKSDNPKE